jgi:hypothetical protein
MLAIPNCRGRHISRRSSTRRVGLALSMGAVRWLEKIVAFGEILNI